jgi:pilus assembly protein CpaE
MVDLIRQARPNDSPPRVVLNRVGVPGRPEIPLKDFGDALGVVPTLAIPFDAKLFGQAANNGQMICEVGPKSKASESLEMLAQMIARRETAPVAAVKPAAGGSASSLISGLFKKKA